MSSIDITISRWSAWMPGVATEPEWRQWAAGQRPLQDQALPALDQIPPMLRRRLSPLGKMALAAAWPLLGEDQFMPSLFCSRHGELERTAGMLQELAHHNALSPTHFSLSVHNAIGGVYSIARGDRSSITALALGADGFSEALLESRLILAEQEVPEALCVIYDAPVPEVYREFGDGPDQPFALAFVLSAASSAKGSALRARLERCAAEEGSPTESAEAQALQFMRFLLNPAQEQLLLPCRGDCWRWSRSD